MKHDKIRETLGEFLDGELPAESAREVEAHLSGCAECAAAAARWRRIGGALFHPGDLAASEGFVDAVVARLPQKPVDAAGWSFRWLAPTVAFTTAALLLMLRPLAVSADELLPSNEEMLSQVLEEL